MGAIHMLKNIMDGHHIWTRQSARHPKHVRNVHEITIQTLENGATFEIAFGRSPFIQQRDRLKGRWERTDLRHLLR
jgi:hypothetical protein